MTSSATWRNLLVGVSIVYVVGAAAFLAFLFWTTPVEISVTDFDEYRTKSLQIIREESEHFFEVAIAILGALWAALVVAKDSRLRAEDWPEIGMFVLSNALLVAFLFFNSRFDDLLAELYWDMRPQLIGEKRFADLLGSKYVSIHRTAILLCFYGGLFLSALTVWSSCMLRKKECVSSSSSG